MGSKRIHPIATVAFLLLAIVLMFWKSEGLSLSAKKWLIINVLSSGTMMFITASLIRLLYNKGRIGIRVYVMIVMLLIVLCACYIVYSYIITLAHEIRQESQLARNAKENMTLLAQEIIDYAMAHNGRLSSADNWCDVIIEQSKKITKTTFKNPGIEKGICNFAFNRNLSGLDINSVPVDVIILFEANGEWNLNGDMELLKDTQTDRQWIIGVVFVDGAFGKYNFASSNVPLELPHKGSRTIRWKP